LVGVLVLIATPAFPQFSQYNAPGSLGVAQIPVKDRLKKAMESARWKLGPLRLAPWAALSDITYQDDVYGTPDHKVSDYTATLGFGLHGYLSRGEKLILGLYALPEYVYWKDLENRRVLNYRYGFGLYAYLNRLTVEVTGSSNRLQQNLSTEFERPVNVGDRRAGVALDLRLSGKLSFFADGSIDSWRHRRQDLPEDASFDLRHFDRDETIERGGLRYKLTERANIDVGYQSVKSEFRQPGRDRSSSGKGPMLRVSLVGPTFELEASAAQIKLEPLAGSQFVPYDRTLGLARITWRSSPRSSLSLYTHRGIGYSIGADPYFQEGRDGVGFAMPLGWRGDFRAFYERVRRSYVAPDGSGTSTRDHFPAYGGSVSFEITQKSRLEVGVTKTQDLAGSTVHAERSITRVQASLHFTGQGVEWW
jgi:hypothetical protein